MRLRISSYEPRNEAGLVAGMGFVVCSCGKFQSCWPGWNSKKQFIKMVEHKRVQFVIVVSSFVDSWNFTYNANLHTSEGEILTSAKLFCKKSFIPVTKAGVLMYEKFHPSYWEFSTKNQDLSHHVSQASHDLQWNFYEKNWMTRQVLGNQASPVVQVQMKGP